PAATRLFCRDRGWLVGTIASSDVRPLRAKQGHVLDRFRRARRDLRPSSVRRASAEGGPRMANVNRRLQTPAASFWPRILAKIAVLSGSCLAAAALLAQAPAPAPVAEPLGKEEVDADGYKYHAPAAKLMKNKAEANTFRNKVKQTLNGQPPLSDATAR